MRGTTSPASRAPRLRSSRRRGRPGPRASPWRARGPRAPPRRACTPSVDLRGACLFKGPELGVHGLEAFLDDRTLRPVVVPQVPRHVPDAAVVVAELPPERVALLREVAELRAVVHGEFDVLEEGLGLLRERAGKGGVEACEPREGASEPTEGKEEGRERQRPGPEVPGVGLP